MWLYFYSNAFFLVRLFKVKLHVFKYLEEFKYLGKREVSVTQSCLTLCDPMGYCLWGSSVHGISQARILEWVTIPLYRELPESRDQNGPSTLQAGYLPSEIKYCYILERMQYFFFLGIGINYNEDTYRKHWKLHLASEPTCA